MNLIFLLFIFLFIRSSYAKCRWIDFKLPINRINCGCDDLVRRPKGRIFNGTDLGRYDAQYVAALYSVNIVLGIRSFHTFCTGSIISPRFVLTAGHCKKEYDKLDKKGTPTYVGAGLNRIVQDMHSRDANHKRIQKFIQHPKIEEYLNDIGLVELKDSFEFDPFLSIEPGCLYLDQLRTEDFDVNKEVIAVGYGKRFEADEDDGSKHLKYSRFQMFRHDVLLLYKIDYSQICSGDSGSPLLWKKGNKLYIIGINTKTVNEECTPGQLNMAEPIYGHIGWILKYVEGEICGTLDKIDEWLDGQEGKPID